MLVVKNPVLMEIKKIIHNRNNNIERNESFATFIRWVTSKFNNVKGITNGRLITRAQQITFHPLIVFPNIPPCAYPIPPITTQTSKAKSPKPIFVIPKSLVSNLKTVTVINPITAIPQNLLVGFSSDNNPANIAVESGTAARTIPPLPAGMVFIATAVKIGNANTTPMAVIISFRKSVLSGKFSDLN